MKVVGRHVMLRCLTYILINIYPRAFHRYHFGFNFIPLTLYSSNFVPISVVHRLILFHRNCVPKLQFIPCNAQVKSVKNSKAHFLSMNIQYNAKGPLCSFILLPAFFLSDLSYTGSSIYFRPKAPRPLFRFALFFKFCTEVL